MVHSVNLYAVSLETNETHVDISIRTNSAYQLYVMKLYKFSMTKLRYRNRIGRADISKPICTGAEITCIHGETNLQFRHSQLFTQNMFS